MAFFPLTIFVLVVAALLALFLPWKHVLLIVLAGAVGIFADVELRWWIPAPGDAYQIKSTLIASTPLHVLAAILGYLWPRKAWQ